MENFIILTEMLFLLIPEQRLNCMAPLIRGVFSRKYKSTAPSTSVDSADTEPRIRRNPARRGPPVKLHVDFCLRRVLAPNVPCLLSCVLPGCSPGWCHRHPHRLWVHAPQASPPLGISTLFAFSQSDGRERDSPVAVHLPNY